jgi:hypothetical protein
VDVQVHWHWRVSLAAAVLLGVAAIAPLQASAQARDPGLTVQAYSEALNAHDVPAALALFDQYGSATDIHGHVFQGRAGLSEFLLANGFGVGAHVSTDQLLVVGNRALWTYTCSCASGPIYVRVVMNQDGISVFAMGTPPSRASATEPATNNYLVTWLLGLGVVVCALAAAYGVRRHHLETPAARPAQGRLIAGLAVMRKPAMEPRR